MQPSLYLMLGYPGAGKTTVAKYIEQLTGAERLSSDETRVSLFGEPTFSPSEHNKLYKHLNQQTRRLLSAKKNVIYDANLNRYAHRQEKYDICKQTGATALLIWVTTDRDLSKNRATNDSRKKYTPPDETLYSLFERIADVIEPPKATEPVVKIDGTNTSQQEVKRILHL